MIFTLILVIDGWAIFYEITLGWVSLHPTDNLVNTGPEEGLVLSGSKPLPEKKLTQICVAVWRHLVNTQSMKYPTCPNVCI